MSSLKKLFDILSESYPHDKVVVVGGAVRDRILGRNTSDYDLALPQNPTSIAKKIAGHFKGNFFPLDDERGVIRVTLSNGIQIDFSQYQGPTLEEDLNRRDFTVNALAVPLLFWMKPQWKRKIIDLHHGLTDLKNKQISVLSPRSLDEDPLRILRAFRIASELNFSISPRTKALLAKKKNLILQSAPERIREEILKLFSVPDAHGSVLQMEKTGLWDVLWPDVKRLRRTADKFYGKGGVLKHTLDSLWYLEDIFNHLHSWFPSCSKKVKAYLNEKISGYSRRAHLKWGILLHDIGKPDTAKVIKGRLRFFEHEHVGALKIPPLAARFRWSGDEMKRYEKLVRHHMRPGNLATHPHVTPKAIHRFFRDLEDDAVGMLLVSLGDHLSYLTPQQLKKRKSPHERLTRKMIRQFYLKREIILPPKLLTGHEVMKAFKLKPSRLIGDLLQDLTDAQSEGIVKTKGEALPYLKTRLVFHQSNQELIPPQKG